MLLYWSTDDAGLTETLHDKQILIEATKGLSLSNINASIGWYNKIPFMEESSGASLPPACSMKLCLRTLMSFAIHFQATKNIFFAGVSLAQHEHWVSFIYVFTFHS